MNEPLDPFNFGSHFEIQHKLNMANDRRVDMPIEEAINRSNLQNKVNKLEIFLHMF